MSNYENEADKLRTHLESLEKRHRDVTVSDDVRKMKTMKLYLKDEIHRLNARLIQIGLQ